MCCRSNNSINNNYQEGFKCFCNNTIGRGIVTGNLSVAGNLSVDGNADFDGDLTVSSLTTQGRAIVGTTLCVGQGATIRQTLYVSGTTQLRSTLSVTGLINIGESESPHIEMTGLSTEVRLVDHISTLTVNLVKILL